jgi:hypothetical protein
MQALRFRLVQVALALVGITVTAGDALAEEPSYAGSSQNITHSCDAVPSVTFGGSSNTITVTGTCKSVVLQGSSNSLTVEASTKVVIEGSANVAAIVATDVIRISGSGNQATWEKGLKAKKPRVSRSGVNNKVAKKAA